MADTDAPRDSNRVTAALGLKSDGSGVAPLLIDSVTGRLLVDLTAE